MRKIILISALISAFALSACGPSRTVTRVASDTQIDLSGRWNDTDAQMVAKEMISDVLSRPWISEYTGKTGKKPVLIVGAVRNKTDEHIQPSVFIKSIEKELLNSGRVRIVANEEEREGSKKELIEQQTEASPETAKRLAQRLGADFYFYGLITSTTDELDRQKVVFYKVNLELYNIESTEKVWIGDKEIKKVIEKSRWKS